MYDKTVPKSIEEYGKRLVGSTLRSTQGVVEIPKGDLDKPISGRTRGSLGNVVEQYYYDIHPGSDSVPDFVEAGVELKTTPIKKNKNGTYVAKERLVLGMIDYIAESEKTFDESSYFKKNEKLMLMSYLHEEDTTIGDVRFLLARLYEFSNLPEEDQKIIRDDWERISLKIKEGLAHELSEGDTMYLGACTKSATSANRREQVGGIPAKPRAFSYKQSYMTALLNREFDTPEDVERLLTKGEELKDKTFEQYVIDKFTPFLGKTVSEITKVLGFELKPKQKDKYAILARTMMGVKKKRIEEFEAAGITMKTIQLRADGMPKEAMSFPTFKYTEVINEIWDGDEEEGELRAEFQKQLETKFLFVVYGCEDKCKAQEERVLKDVFFWTMPQKDLDEAQKVWEETVKRINDGKAENLPLSSESSVAHVRPHAQDSNDTFETPQGEQVVKKCFWLNKGYIKTVCE